MFFLQRDESDGKEILIWNSSPRVRSSLNHGRRPWLHLHQACTKHARRVSADLHASVEKRVSRKLSYCAQESPR